MEAIRTDKSLSVVFGPSGHKTGEVFDKGIMLGFFVSQKQKVDGIFTISVGANV